MSNAIGLYDAAFTNAQTNRRGKSQVLIAGKRRKIDRRVAPQRNGFFPREVAGVHTARETTEGNSYL
jgi:hypothetical protein